MRCTTEELHKLDFGAHTHMLEEWNDSDRFIWGEAEVLYDFPESTVTHHATCSAGDVLVVARYRTDGEGDITYLVVHDRQRVTINLVAHTFGTES